MVNRFWDRKKYGRQRPLVAVSVISIYIVLVCFNVILHNHSIGINEITSHPFSISNQNKSNQKINNVKIISQHQSIPCLACAFKNNNKVRDLQIFAQVRTNHVSSVSFPSRILTPQSIFLKSLQVRAPPIDIS